MKLSTTIEDFLKLPLESNSSGFLFFNHANKLLFLNAPIEPKTFCIFAVVLDSVTISSIPISTPVEIQPYGVNRKSMGGEKDERYEQFQRHCGQGFNILRKNASEGRSLSW